MGKVLSNITGVFLNYIFVFVMIGVVINGLSAQDVSKHILVAIGILGCWVVSILFKVDILYSENRLLHEAERLRILSNAIGKIEQENKKIQEVVMAQANLIEEIYKK